MKNERWDSVRWTAVARVTDQIVLAEIAKNDRAWRVREKAIERLTDQTALAEIVKRERESSTVSKAVARLTHQTVLAEIAKPDCPWLIRHKAIESVTDETVLAEIARRDSDGRLRKDATERLTDQAVLAEIARRDSDEEVRRRAIDRLADQAVLGEIAKAERYSGVSRWLAVSRLIDQPALGDVAMHSQDNLVGRIAVDKLTDQVVLNEVAANATNVVVQRLAAWKLADNVTLAPLAPPKYSPEPRYELERSKDNMKSNALGFGRKLLTWIGFTPSEHPIPDGPLDKMDVLEYADFVCRNPSKEALETLLQIQTEKVYVLPAGEYFDGRWETSSEGEHHTFGHPKLDYAVELHRRTCPGVCYDRAVGAQNAYMVRAAAVSVAKRLRCAEAQATLDLSASAGEARFDLARCPCFGPLRWNHPERRHRHHQKD